MAEHRVRKNNIIYIIPTDELFIKWKNDEAFIDEYGRLMNRKPHRVLKELKHYVADSVVQKSYASPIKDLVRDKMVEYSKYAIDRAEDVFFYEVIPNVWHKHIVPLWKGAKDVLFSKELKIDQIKCETEHKVVENQPILSEIMTKEEVDAEKRKLLYHWIGLLSSLTKLQNAGELDVESTLAQLTEPMMIERVNALLSENPNLLETDKYILLHSLLGRDLYMEGRLIPIRATEINMVAKNNGGLTTKRLINVAKELDSQLQENQKYTGFEVYNVNNYDFFRNPLEARDLIIQALEIQPFPQSDVWDGELDGRMVKIMPVNRIATKADLEELKANLPYKTYEKRKADNPTQPVERITIVCMGHEPDLKASLEQGLSEYKLDIEIVDILRDKKDLQLKREAEAEIVKEGSKLVIRSFYPMNLMQKLSLQKEYVEDWRQLVESIMIDWNYDGVVMQPTITDVPDKKEIVSGIYDIPEDAGTIRVKITDLLSESLEMEVE